MFAAHMAVDIRVGIRAAPDRGMAAVAVPNPVGSELDPGIEGYMAVVVHEVRPDRTDLKNEQFL